MKIIFLKLFMLFAISLYAKEEIAQKPFEELIIGYNHGFIKAMQKRKFNHLQEYLTQQIYYKTRVWIESFQANNYFMQSMLLEMKFEDLVVEQYSATFVTKEQWKYRYIDIRTNEVVKSHI